MAVYLCKKKLLHNINCITIIVTFVAAFWPERFCIAAFMKDLFDKVIEIQVDYYSCRHPEVPVSVFTRVGIRNTDTLISYDNYCKSVVPFDEGVCSRLLSILRLKLPHSSDIQISCYPVEKTGLVNCLASLKDIENDIIFQLLYYV